MENKDLKICNKCRACGSTNIKSVIQLLPTASEGDFISKDQLDEKQKLYDSEVVFCVQCSFLQMKHLLDSNVIYENYYYETKATLGLNKHFVNYADDVLKSVGVDKKILVVDLGSNDGGMLKAFKDRGKKVIGVEPCKSISESANNNGIKTINSFFHEEVVNEILKNDGHADIITANNMYANIEKYNPIHKKCKKTLSS